MSQLRVPARQELLDGETWNLQDLYPNQQAWEAAGNEIRQRADAFAQFKGRLGESPAVLLAAMRAEDEIGRRIERYYAWAMFSHDQDTQDPMGTEAQDKARVLLADAMEKTAFVRPELVALPEGRLATFLDQEKDLAPYRRTFKEIERRKAHVLSVEVEGVLSALEPVLGAAKTTASQLSDADFDFGTILDGEGGVQPLTHSRYGPYLRSPDRTLRQNAYLGVQKLYMSHKNAFASTLSQEVRGQVTEARLRHYPTALSMHLDARALPDAVYQNLLVAVDKALADLHRYVAWRKRRLGLDAFHFYDLYTPVVEEREEASSWDEALREVESALQPLGPDYQGKLRQFVSGRNIDARENLGKRSGAYSMDVYDVHPFILMSFTGERESVFTLAHELGHSLHSLFSTEHQDYRNAQYPIFLAEVASTTNEHLLLHSLLERTEEKNARLDLLDKLAQNFLGTVFRQTLFAEFELQIHTAMEEGGALTAEGLCKMYRELLEKYYGPDLVVDDVGTAEWARIPHFYMNYYVFQYATGFISAAALGRAVLKEGEEAATRYLSFLSAGGSDDPLPILARAGVDLSTPDALQKGLGEFRDLVTELERLG